MTIGSAALVQEALVQRGYPCVVRVEDGNVILVENDLVGVVRYYGDDVGDLSEGPALDRVVNAFLRTEVRYLLGSDVVEHRALLSDLLQAHRAHGESAELASFANVLQRHGLLTQAEYEWVVTSVVRQRRPLPTKLPAT
jgi:hypothetical protein